jgi:endonuclease/exonuclease/phosphatase family metal-dependent hydrolase
MPLGARMSVVRFLSYNVRYFGHATRGLASTAKAMDRIARAIAALDLLPDVVCLQEVETASIRSTVAHRASAGETQLGRFTAMLDAALGEAGKGDVYDAYYFPAHAYRLGSSGAHVYTTGLAVLALATWSVEHHNADEPHDITARHLHPIRQLKQTRVCAHVRLRRPGALPIDVFNTHLSLPSTMSREFWTLPRRLGWGPNQLVEAKRLVEFIDRERASERFVVMGDFNSLPGSPVHRYLARECGLTDVFAKLHRMTEDELVHWPTAGFMRMRMHLDHVFSGSGLRWVDFDDSCPFGDRTSPFHRLSDHVPLIGRFRIPRASRPSIADR